MTVREFLEKQTDMDLEIKVYQFPIKEIDSCKELVRRYWGNIKVSLNSNQNYLNYRTEGHYYNNGYLVIICRANEEQEQRTIKAYRD